MSRVKFNTYAFEWSQCMEMCPKYDRAMVPSFTNQEEYDKLIAWALITTSDPVDVNNDDYNDVNDENSEWTRFNVLT